MKTLLSLVITCVCLLPAAAEPGPTIRRPEYRIYPLVNGRCDIAGQHAFLGGNTNETYGFMLYVWLVLGGEKPILIDAGLSDVADMNRGAAHVLRRPITQQPDETSRAQLRRFGLTPSDIGHVFVTHLHFDHVDDLLTYTNAKIYVGRTEWEKALATPASWAPGRILNEFTQNPQARRRLVLVSDEEPLPGIESFWIGGHTPGSTAYAVNTAHDKAVLTGDTISLLANFERNTPGGIFTSQQECYDAIAKIRSKATVVLPSHDPGTIDRWPPSQPGAPKYTIRAVKVGECDVRDYITYQDSTSEETSRFFLYVFVIEGGPRPMLVETGPKYPAEFSRGTARYIPGGVRQRPEERTVAALKRAGIEASAVSHVIATHLHADHYDYFDAFPNARLVVNRREYENSRGGLAADVRKALDSRPDVLQLVGEDEVVPGVKTVRLGCHTEGSQGVLVQTRVGPVLLAGDVVYKYENLEKDRPTRSPDERLCREALRRIRSLADIVVPAHDPETLERWPGGVIGAY